MARAEDVRAHPFLCEVLAVGAAALALASRFTLDSVLPPGFPFLTFFPAVILTAFFLGLRAGITCAVLSGIAAWYFFIPPVGSLQLDMPTALALGLYVFIVSVDLALIHVMQTAGAELRREQATTARLYDQQRTMFQELQHRVANNMQFVAALLTLQRKRVIDDPDKAVTALDEARVRLETISRIHRRLYDPERISLPVGEYLQGLCSDLLEATGAQNIVCLVDMSPVQLDLTRLTTLSLLIVEVVTNSLKHAFEPGRGGTIRVRLEQLEDNALALSIVDDGRGIPADFDPAVSRSLGMRITHGLAAQLGGTLFYGGGQGTQVRLVFAASPGA